MLKGFVLCGGVGCEFEELGHGRGGLDLLDVRGARVDEEVHYDLTDLVDLLDVLVVMGGRNLLLL